MKKEVIGVYTVSNAIAVSVYEIDYVDDRVLVSGNNEKPKWCPIVDRENEEKEYESGFMLGKMFIPFSEVMRV